MAVPIVKVDVSLGPAARRGVVPHLTESVQKQKVPLPSFELTMGIEAGLLAKGR
jgi:hypothetical protein